MTELSIGLFLDEETVLGKYYEVRALPLYNHYSWWAKENKVEVVPIKFFGTELGEAFEKVRKSDGIYYKGMKLNVDANALFGFIREGY